MPQIAQYLADRLTDKERNTLWEFINMRRKSGDSDESNKRRSLNKTSEKDDPARK